MSDLDASLCCSTRNHGTCSRLVLPCRRTQTPHAHRPDLLLAPRLHPHQHLLRPLHRPQDSHLLHLHPRTRPHRQDHGVRGQRNLPARQPHRQRPHPSHLRQHDRTHHRHLRTPPRPTAHPPRPSLHHRQHPHQHPAAGRPQHLHRWATLPVPALQQPGHRRLLHDANHRGRRPCHPHRLLLPCLLTTGATSRSDQHGGRDRHGAHLHRRPRVLPADA